MSTKTKELMVNEKSYDPKAQHNELERFSFSSFFFYLGLFVGGPGTFALACALLKSRG